MRRAVGYVLFHAGRVLCLRWLTTPTVGDADMLIREVTRAREHTGEQLLCIGVIRSDMPMPAMDVRDLMVRRWPELMSHCDAMHFVLLGTGIKASLMRSLLRGMVLVARVRGVAIHDDASDLTRVLRHAGVRGSTVVEVQKWLREAPFSLAG
jgi:hypothetical protein